MKIETLTEKVTSAIKDSSKTVQNKVIDVLVEREIEKRSSALVKGIDQLSKLKVEINKIRPDVINYDADGKAIGEGSFSKPTVDKLKQTKEKFNKLERAIQKALGSEESPADLVTGAPLIPAKLPDYSDLFNLVNSGDNKDASPKPAE